MNRRITETCRKMAREFGVGLIPVGTSIQRVRETLPEFDYGNGGMSLCRDGRHLDKMYGRLIAAAAWFRALTGRQLEITEFADFDPALLAKIVAIVNAV